MGYGKRIDTLCSLLTPAKVFADVGCDHGYCTEYMLKNAFCERAIFSDVSKGSLAKAEKLLAPYVRAGKAVGVLGDGFYGVDKEVDEVLIAGMGGSEILSILSDEKYGFMPKRFVFQPMHDSEKLRRYLLSNGGYIERDYTFEDGKFYDVIVGGKVEEVGQVCVEYTDAEYEFGRENLRKMPDAFVKRTKKQIANIEKYMQQPNLQEESKQALAIRKERLQGVLSGEIK
ncbi:MAG: SAM-dependent methyltransferase [Clostridia bacterium]|nr:SAM-dependent methyltransferase [Clostridia bacterium]